MSQATRETREAGWGWILETVLAWAVQPSGPSTIYPESSFAEDERSGGSGFRFQLSHHWKRCKEASVTHAVVPIACVL